MPNFDLDDALLDLELRSSPNKWTPIKPKNETDHAAIAIKSCVSFSVFRLAALRWILLLFCSVLNKLAPERFERLVAQASIIIVTRVETLCVIVDSIFDKAVIEHNYAPLYAKVG